MANNDSASNNVRFNLDSQQLEFAAAQDWFAVPSSSTPGGDNTAIQFNDSGTFGGSPTLTYDATNSTEILTHRGDGYASFQINGSGTNITFDNNLGNTVDAQIVSNEGADFSLSTKTAVPIQIIVDQNGVNYIWIFNPDGSVKLPSITGDPVTPVEGSLWYDVVSHTYRGFNGTDLVTFDVTPD